MSETLGKLDAQINERVSTTDVVDLFPDSVCSWEGEESCSSAGYVEVEGEFYSMDGAADDPEAIGEAIERMDILDAVLEGGLDQKEWQDAAKAFKELDEIMKGVGYNDLTAAIWGEARRCKNIIAAELPKPGENVHIDTKENVVVGKGWNACRDSVESMEGLRYYGAHVMAPREMYALEKLFNITGKRQIQLGAQLVFTMDTLQFSVTKDINYCY